MNNNSLDKEIVRIMLQYDDSKETAEYVVKSLKKNDPSLNSLYKMYQYLKNPFSNKTRDGILRYKCYLQGIEISDKDYE